MVTLARAVLVSAAVMVSAPALSQPPPMPQTPPPPADPADVLPAHGLRLPATFRGDLPCADCEAVRHHLDLWPDQVFHLRREWVGKDFVRGDLGRWRIDPGRRALVLYGGFEMPISLEIKGPDTLRQMDLQGRPIESALPYELKSDGTLRPTSLATTFAGEVSIGEPGLRFTECLTGRSYRLEGGEPFDKLREAHQRVVKEPGTRIYVTFDGTLAAPPGTGGPDAPAGIRVDRFINVWPGQRCEQARGRAELVNTYWRIVKLGGEVVSPAPGRREPHLLLRLGERPGYAATVGCNQLVGGYAAGGDTITFTPPAMTRIACPPPLRTLERALGDALTRTRRWRINGNTMEFFDEQGNPTALFEAVYL